MSALPDAYEITCSTGPELNGTYERTKPNYYVQKDGKHVLTRHTTGQWGVGDLKFFNVLAQDAANTPEETKVWKYLSGTVYNVCIFKVVAKAPQQDMPLPLPQAKRYSSPPPQKKESPPPHTPQWQKRATSPSPGRSPSASDEYFSIVCLQAPAINGEYFSTPTNNKRFLQKDGKHIFTQHTTGQWGVGDGLIYLILAVDSATTPEETKKWNYFVTKANGYKPCIPGTVRIERKTVVSEEERKPALNITHSSSPPPLPAVPSASLDTEWVVQHSASGFDVYISMLTAAKYTSLPEAVSTPIPFPRLGQAEVKSVAGGPALKIYAPAGYSKLGGSTIMSSRWEKLWADSNAAYDNELSRCRAVIEALTNNGAVEKAQLMDSVASLRQELSAATTAVASAKVNEAKHQENAKALNSVVQQLKESLQTAQAQARAGSASAAAVTFVKRDASPATGGSVFPCGDELRAEFETELAFAGFEGFACDAVNCLEDYLGHAEHVATDLFVQQVMAPLHAVTQQHVEGLIRAKHAHMQGLCGVAVWSDGVSGAAVSAEESDAKRFFFSSLQASILCKMQYIDDNSVTALMSSMGPLVGALHAALEGIASTPGRELVNKDLSIAKLVRLILRLHTVAALSDPRCFLHPAPGARLPYKEGLHQEILSPGVKKHGRIKEGDTVEVVLPGLYFDKPLDYGAVAAARDPPAPSPSTGEGLVADPVAPPVAALASDLSVKLPLACRPIVQCLMRRVI